MVHLATKSFLGEIQQIPPQFSAIRIDGKAPLILQEKGKC
jgi:tRNA U55 pseudouridine synthase TruB